MQASAAIFVAIGFVVVAGIVWLPDPNQQNLEAAFSPPLSAGHILGTDALGRDVFSWIASGMRTALIVSMAVVFASAVIGSIIGLVAGYIGGALDALLMRLVDLQLAVPPILLFVTVAVVVGSSLESLVVLLSAVGWVPYARVVRSKILSERERSYVAAARLAGATHREVVFTHLARSAASLIVVLASAHAGFVILWESGLSFLGLGLQPPLVSLGFIIALGRQYLMNAWWVVTLPGTAIVLLVLAFNLLGDALRDRFSLDVGLVE
jgi:peptide/nickel transport system permease protein